MGVSGALQPNRWKQHRLMGLAHRIAAQRPVSSASEPPLLGVSAILVRRGQAPSHKLVTFPPPPPPFDIRNVAEPRLLIRNYETLFLFERGLPFPIRPLCTHTAADEMGNVHNCVYDILSCFLLKEQPCIEISSVSFGASQNKIMAKMLSFCLLVFSVLLNIPYWNCLIEPSQKILVSDIGPVSVKNIGSYSRYREII